MFQRKLLKYPTFSPLCSSFCLVLRLWKGRGRFCYFRWEHQRYFKLLNESNNLFSYFIHKCLRTKTSFYTNYTFLLLFLSLYRLSHIFRMSILLLLPINPNGNDQVPVLLLLLFYKSYQFWFTKKHQGQM